MSFESFNDNAGYTGRLFEQEILAKLPDEWKNQGFFNEQKSYEWVRMHQPWNPSDPQNTENSLNHIANDLHYKVAEALKLEDINELKFFTALNSPLDQHFGIDAFFQLGTKVFTVDFTTNPHKVSHKADIIIRPKNLRDEASIELIAQEISVCIRKQLNSQEKFAA